MNRLYKITAIVEVVIGLALIVAPTNVVRLLLGGEISGASIPLSRVAGIGFLSLGIAFWPRQSSIGNTVPALGAMLTYNSLVTLYFIWLCIGGEWVGPILWPAAALHGCLTLLLARRWRSLRNSN